MRLNSAQKKILQSGDRANRHMKLLASDVLGNKNKSVVFEVCEPVSGSHLQMSL